MESALKNSDFHCGDGDAKANWTKFGNSILGKLEADPELSEAVKYFAKQPPRKQVIINGHLDWKDVNKQHHATLELLECVKRVRNNLFHGGKFSPTGEWFMPVRDEALFVHSISVLKACLRASEKLRAAY
jgi:hypothetical protein